MSKAEFDLAILVTNLSLFPLKPTGIGPSHYLYWEMTAHHIMYFLSSVFTINAGFICLSLTLVDFSLILICYQKWILKFCRFRWPDYGHY